MVAVVRFRDGKTGIKVLPRVMPSINYYYNHVIAAKDVIAVDLYMSNNIFFNRYPNSSALRVHYLDEATITEHLKDAKRLARQ